MSVPCSRCNRALPERSQGTVSCACGREQRVWPFRPYRGEPPPPRPALGAEASCATHAENAAAQPCDRCGTFMCALCATPVQGGTFCPACLDTLVAGRELPVFQSTGYRPHVAVFLLGILALVPCLGLAAVPVMVWQGMAAVRQRAELAERESGVVGWLALGSALALCGLVLTAALIVRLVQAAS